MLRRGLGAGALLIACGLTNAPAGSVGAQATAPADAALARQVDAIANQVLQSTGVPSASVAVVKNGRVAYANAYGAARCMERLSGWDERNLTVNGTSRS